MLTEVRYWKMQPRELMDVPSLERFNARLDGVLNNLIQSKMSLLLAGGGWSRGSLLVPSKAKHSMIL